MIILGKKLFLQTKKKQQLKKRLIKILNFKRSNNNKDYSNNKEISEENEELSEDYIETEKKIITKKIKTKKNISLEIIELSEEEKK